MFLDFTKLINSLLIFRTKIVTWEYTDDFAAVEGNETFEVIVTLSSRT